MFPVIAFSRSLLVLQLEDSLRTNNHGLWDVALILASAAVASALIQWPPVSCAEPIK